MKQLYKMVLLLMLLCSSVQANDLAKLSMTKTIVATDTTDGTAVGLISDTSIAFRLTTRRSWIGWSVVMPPGFAPVAAFGDSLSIIIQHSPDGFTNWIFYDSLGANASGNNQNLASDKFVLVAGTTTINTDSTPIMPYIRFVFQVTDSLHFHVDSFGNTYTYSFTPYIFPVILDR